MNSTDETSISADAYTPGFRIPKAFMALLGIVLFAMGMWQIKSPLWLVIFGDQVRAEATDVVKTKAGLPEMILKDPLQVQSNLEPRDRSYIFWNEFQFHTRDGNVVNVRAPVGSQLKPIYPLLDDDGLPTTDLVCYDPTHPDVVVFPWLTSTWFAPGVLVFIGLLTCLIGSVFFDWATYPIAMPHIPGAADKPKSVEG